MALIVTLESMGVPLPGETMLIAVAIFAAKTGQTHIATVIGAAAAGAILGDNIGYWIGRKFGYPLVVRYGRFIRLTEPRIKLGQYLFLRYGGRIVFLPASTAWTGAVSWRQTPQAALPGQRFTVSVDTWSETKSPVCWDQRESPSSRQ